jgi:hypothetical protein
MRKRTPEAAPEVRKNEKYPYLPRAPVRLISEEASLMIDMEQHDMRYNIYHVIFICYGGQFILAKTGS